MVRTRLKGNVFLFAKGGFGKRVDKFDLDNQGSTGRASKVLPR